MKGKLGLGNFRNRTRKGKERKEKNKNKKEIVLVSDLKNINASTDSVTFNHVVYNKTSFHIGMQFQIPKCY